MLSAGVEPAIPASERPQTLALDRSVTGIGVVIAFTTVTQPSETLISCPIDVHKV